MLKKWSETSRSTSLEFQEFQRDEEEVVVGEVVEEEEVVVEEVSDK